MARLNIEMPESVYDSVGDYAVSKGILKNGGTANYTAAGLALIEAGLSAGNQPDSSVELSEAKSQAAHYRQIAEMMGYTGESGLNGIVGGMVKSQFDSQRLEEATRELKKKKEECEELERKLKKQKEKFEEMEKEDKIMKRLESLGKVLTPVALNYIDKNPAGVVAQSLGGIAGVEVDCIEMEIGRRFMEAFPTDELRLQAQKAMAMLQKSPESLAQFAQAFDSTNKEKEASND